MRKIILKLSMFLVLAVVSPLFTSCVVVGGGGAPSCDIGLEDLPAFATNFDMDMNVEYAGVTLTCSGNASDLRVANDLRITTSISGADPNTYQDAANQIWFQNCIPFDVLSCSN
jgi:hypothetical protein